MKITPSDLCARARHLRLDARLVRSVLPQVSIDGRMEWRLPSARFYLGDTEDVARKLLGALLLHVKQGPSGGGCEICGGRIVEVEAYLGERDPACHAARGLTERTRIFYQPGGVAYVFRSYGMHDCFNVITLPRGQAGCVLVRALEPLFGIEIMARRRGVDPRELLKLCSGPGKLCQALGLSLVHNWCCLRTGPVLVLLPRKQTLSVARSRRIGLTRAADRVLRFYADGSRWVSTQAR